MNKKQIYFASSMIIASAMSVYLVPVKYVNPITEIKELDDNINQLIKKADLLYAEGKLEEALAVYEQAIEIDKTNKYVADRIVLIEAAIEKKKTDALKQKFANEKYTNLIKAADQLFKDGKLNEAMAKYNEAIDEKDDEDYPFNQIKAIKKKLADAQSDEKYKSLMESAAVFMNQKSWKAALDAYGAASKLKPDEPLPKAKIAEITGKEKQEKEAQDLAAKLEKEKQEKEAKELAAKLEKERLEKDAKELAAKLEKEKQEKEAKELAAKLEKERLEKEAKELAAKLEKEKQEKEAKELAAKLEKEKQEKEAKELAAKLEKERLEKEAKELAAKLEKEKQEKEAKELAAKLEKEKQEKEAKELAAKLEKEKQEKEAQELAAKLEKEKQEKEAKELAAKIEKEKQEKEAKELAAKLEKEKQEKEAQELAAKLEKEKQEQAAKELAAKLLAEKEAAEKLEKEKAELATKLEKEKQEQAAKELAAKLLAEKEAAEKLEKEKAELAAKQDKEKQEQAAKDLAAKLLAEKEAAEKLEKEKAELAAKQDKEKQEQAAKDLAAKLLAEKEAAEKLEKEKAELAAKQDKEKQEQAAKDLAAKLLAEKEAAEKLEKEKAELADKQDKEKQEQAAKDLAAKLLAEKDAAAKLEKEKQDQMAKELAAKEQATKDLEAKLEKEKQEAANKINNLYSEGLQLMSKTNYALAKTNFEKIVALDKDHQLAHLKLAEIEEIWGNQQAKNQMKEQIDKLMFKAQTMENAKKYGEALSALNDVQLLEDSPNIQAEIKRVQALINKQQAEKGKRESYTQYMSAANAAMDAKDYISAIKQYNSALDLYPNEKEPVEKAAIAERLEKESTADRDRIYKKTLEAGQKAIDEKNWESAKDLYNRAITYRSEEKEFPEKKLKEIENLIRMEDMGKDKFAKTVEKANKEFDSKAFAKALASYNEANSLLPNNPHVLEQIKKATIEVDKANVAAQNVQKVINEADKLFKSKQYQFALNKYNTAANLDKNNGYVQKQIMATKNILAQIEKEKAQPVTIDVVEDPKDRKFKKRLTADEIIKIYEANVKSDLNQISDENTDFTQGNEGIIGSSSRAQQASSIAVIEQLNNTNSDTKLKVNNEDLYTNNVDRTTNNGSVISGGVASNDLAAVRETGRLLNQSAEIRLNGENAQIYHDNLYLSKTNSDIITDQNKDAQSRSHSDIENLQNTSSDVKIAVDDSQRHHDQVYLTKSNEDQISDNGKNQQVRSIQVNEKFDTSTSNVQQLIDVSVNEENHRSIVSKELLNEQQAQLNTKQNEILKEQDHNYQQILSKHDDSRIHLNNSAKAMEVQSDGVDKNIDALKTIHQNEQSKASLSTVVTYSDLASKYPEGVSQEIKTKYNDYGEVEQTITYRVVVTNGTAALYTRTRTANSNYYTKNGVTVSEYIYQVETNDGKLKRNF